MALLELPDVYTPEGALRVRTLLGESARLLRSASLDMRELPRLWTLGGFLEYQLGDTGQATEQFSKAAKRCEVLRDWECYAVARQNMAALAEEQQDWVVALEAYEDALRPLDPAIAPESVAIVADNIGRLEGKVGLFGRSERSRRMAMRLYARLGECSGARRALSSLGRLLVQVGSVADARIYLSKAVSLSCSELLTELGAETAFESESVAAESAVCARSPNLGDLSTDGRIAVFQAYSSLIDVLLLEGQAKQARECISVAENYAANPRSQVELANAYGTVLLDQGQPALARAPFTNALSLSDSADLPATYDQRGIAYLGLARSALELGQAEAARDAAHRALRMSSARADVSQIVASLQLLAAGARESNDTDEAIQTLRAAVRLIEQVPIDELDGEKRATYLATQHAVFAELTELLISQAAARKEAAWDAFEISEQGRARSLRHAVNQTARDAGSELSERSLEQYRSLLTRIAALTEQKGPAEALSRQLEELSLPDAGITRDSQQLDRAAILQQLEHLNATLVEYVIGREDMFAFVIDRGELHVTRLGSREAIATAAADLTRYLRSAEVVPRRVQAAARELAKLVWWPVSGYVTKNRVIFVPDDALHTVPFAALPWAEATPDELILHKVETVLVPSALLISNPRQPSGPRGQSRFALIGDPIFRAADWRRECVQSMARAWEPATSTTRSIADWAELLPRLPGTRSEVLAITELLQRSHPGSRIETRLGCTATPNALRAAAESGSALLHIATHGRVDAQRPRLSALALSPEPSVMDGAAFGLLDILGLKLQSRLVVLSACDTSRGRLLPGEGVLGLAQAFLQAGAHSVVASHWRIEDDITATFMQRFYKHLLTEGLPAATALRRAQLDQWKNEASYNWAAFSLYGWPDSTL
jgi:CHAT domain-containing protein